MVTRYESMTQSRNGEWVSYDEHEEIVKDYESRIEELQGKISELECEIDNLKTFEREK